MGNIKANNKRLLKGKKGSSKAQMEDESIEEESADTTNEGAVQDEVAPEGEGNQEKMENVIAQ